MEPKFHEVDDDINMRSGYRVYCPECYDNTTEHSCMVSWWSAQEVESRWNDWDCTFEEWEDDLDY